EEEFQYTPPPSTAPPSAPPATDAGATSSAPADSAATTGTQTGSAPGSAYAIAKSRLRRRPLWIALGALVAVILLLLVVAQLVLPGIAAQQLRDRLSRSGRVLEV